jgi:hypothetical protein
MRERDESEGDRVCGLEAICLRILIWKMVETAVLRMTAWILHMYSMNEAAPRITASTNREQNQRGRFTHLEGRPALFLEEMPPLTSSTSFASC